MNKEEFINLSNKKHNDKYDYSKTTYESSDSKVIIMCPKHGEFLQTPHNHLKGQGCPKCGRELAHNKRRYDKETYIEKANKIHRNKYDYSKLEYKGAKEKVCIICPKHGEFKQRADTHLSGSGCPKCARER